LIITDDLSTDSTLSIIELFSKQDSRIKVFKLDINSGAGVARNNSIKHSSGRFISFLDSDDLWTSNKLEVQIDYMMSKNIAFSFSYYEKFTGDDRVQGVVKTPIVVNYDTLLFNNLIGCLTVVYDVSILGKFYMPSIRKRQDLALWLSILNTGCKAECVPHVLAKYRLDSGMTRNKFSVFKYQWKFYRDELNFSLLKSLHTFVLYAFYGMVNYLK
jgi:glycosyltransferase involved in cell wall biosynthesis